MTNGDVDLAALIEETTVDAYGAAEQLGAFHAVLNEHVEVPFTTTVLDVEVAVVGVDLSLPPEGVEWIRAYRAWVAGGLV